MVLSGVVVAGDPGGTRPLPRCAGEGRGGVGVGGLVPRVSAAAAEGRDDGGAPRRAGRLPRLVRACVPITPFMPLGGMFKVFIIKHQHYLQRDTGAQGGW